MELASDSSVEEHVGLSSELASGEVVPCRVAHNLSARARLLPEMD